MASAVTMGTTNVRPYALKGERIGHEMGVRSLTYAGDGMMLSAAFDLVVFGWDVSGLSIRPLFQLRGHTVPLLASGRHRARAHASFATMMHCSDMS